MRELQEIESGGQTIMELTFERAGFHQPVCVAEAVSRRYIKTQLLPISRSLRN